MLKVEKMEQILDEMDQMNAEKQELYANMMMQFAPVWNSGFEAGFRAGLARAEQAGAE
jgi:hypothetical protein